MTGDRDDAQGDGAGMAPPGSHTPSDRPQCTAVTVDGTRCEGVVVPGLEVCHHHLGQSDNVDTRDDPVGERDGGDEDDLDDDVQAVLEEHPPNEILVEE